jgi:hypothetical protein
VESALHPLRVRRTLHSFTGPPPIPRHRTVRSRSTDALGVLPDGRRLGW